jgi:RNA polymerase sigma-70 factor (ECF subfamily)
MITTMQRPDLDAIATALADDLQAAFPDYVRATADGIYSGALRMLGDHHDAEDVFQETYVRAMRAMSGYDHGRISSLRLAGWTWTIAANLCRNRLRSRSRKPTSPLDHAPEAAAEADTATAALAAVDGPVQRALLELTFPQRAAIVLRHVLDLGYDDIAAALERPVGTVKADVHRGLARLRQILTPEVTT